MSDERLPGISAKQESRPIDIGFSGGGIVSPMANDEAARKALAQLEKALRYARGAECGDPGLFEQFRNSVIQTFEAYSHAGEFLEAALALLSRLERG